MRCSHRRCWSASALVHGQNTSGCVPAASAFSCTHVRGVLVRSRSLLIGNRRRDKGTLQSNPDLFREGAACDSLPLSSILSLHRPPPSSLHARQPPARPFLVHDHLLSILTTVHSLNASRPSNAQLLSPPHDPHPRPSRQSPPYPRLGLRPVRSARHDYPVIRPALTTLVPSASCAPPSLIPPSHRNIKQFLYFKHYPVAVTQIYSYLVRTARLSVSLTPSR